MSDYLLFLLEVKGILGCGKVKLLTPLDAKGCQLSLLVPEIGKRVFADLTAAGIFADWREPDVIRIAPVPLYNTFYELWQFASALAKALQLPG